MLLARNANVLDWEVEALVSRMLKVRGLGLGGAMLAIVVGVAGLSYWDLRRESAAAMEDFAEEQAVLARAVGAALRARAAVGPALTAADVMTDLRAVERAHALVLVARRPDEAVWHMTSGQVVASPALTAALARGASVVRLSRDQASELGLPARTALAGLSRVDAGPGGAWDVVAVATAGRERDREDWARRRLLLTVGVAVALVAALGGIALANQRKELLLERELAVASLEKRRDERLERAGRAAAMGTLAMGVAHEISTPLGVIAARAEQILPRVAHDERLAGGMTAILAQTDRINQVIRGLLGLARGDAPSAERIDPRRLVDEAVAMVEHRFAKASVPLQKRIEDPVPAAVVGDPRLLEHAVINLLLNACDACRPPAGVTIALRQRGDRQVEIAVEDGGCGISPADVDRAFEPFFTTKAREGGTGLGLAIAREIVASHRGKLVFSAGQERGTRAAILLPIHATEAMDGIDGHGEPARQGGDA
ncbi:MAG TPA: ATP-binding protein [Polyangia bacterium]